MHPDVSATTLDDRRLGLVAVDDEGLIVEVTPALADHLGQSPHALIGRPLESLLPAATVRAAGEDAFRLFFDSSPYGQVLVDGAGTIVLANRALQKILGYREEELVGRPLEILIPERHRARHAVLLEEYFEDPRVRMVGNGRELVARHADGSDVAVEIGLAWVPWGGAEHAVATVADISGRARLELQLHRANATLEEFLHVASHDLRSPLRGIRDLVDWLREDLESALDAMPPAVTRNLDRIAVRVDRMQTLMDALFAYARSAGGAGSSGRAAVLGPVEVGELVRGILELDPLPAGFRLELDVDVEPFPAVRSPLETVLRNLLANAVKHHDRAAGVIGVTARPDGTFCRIDVRDDGPGVPPAAHERIFRLFQTLDDGPGRSGIGLALVKRLVGSHGGRVEVVSPADGVGGRGAIFRVWWPRIPRRGLHES
ncbi:MAG TPA: PAS domain S-box protein [Kineosporiaceae bacterium]